MGLLSVPAVLQRKQAGTLHIGLGDTLMPRAASLYKKCPAYRLQYKPYRASCLDVILFRQVVKVVSFSGTASLDSPYKTGVKACPEIEKHGYFLPKTAPQVVCGIAVEPHSLQWSRAITRHNPCTAVERFLKERSWVFSMLDNPIHFRLIFPIFDRQVIRGVWLKEEGRTSCSCIVDRATGESSCCSQLPYSQIQNYKKKGKWLISWDRYKTYVTDLILMRQDKIGGDCGRS